MKALSCGAASGPLVASLAGLWLLGCADVRHGPGAGNEGQGTGGSGVVETGTGGSGGRTSPPPPPPPTGAGGSSTPRTCGKTDFDIMKKPATVVLVQDRSGSMQNTPTGGTQTKWQLTTAAVIDAITKTDQDISWGLKTFPEGDGNCVVTATVDVPVAAANGTRLVGAINATTPDGDGTPTGEAITAATNYIVPLSAPGLKYMVLSTDGDPTCTSGITGTVAALQAAAAMGINTFVIGIGTGSQSPTNLNMMAEAGGVPRAVTNPLDTKYYRADSQQELAQALAAITGQVISCSFPLSTPPPLPEGVHVQVNGMEIYIDKNHGSGWDYTDANYGGLQIFGPACAQIQAGNVQVHIVYDCKPVIPT